MYFEYRFLFRFEPIPSYYPLPPPPVSLSLFCFPFFPPLPLGSSPPPSFFVSFIGPFGIVGLLDGIDIAVETRASTLETLDGGPLLISTTVQSRSRRGKIYGNWILM